MAGATIAVNIVSSERPVWSGEAKQVVVPAYAAFCPAMSQCFR